MGLSWDYKARLTNCGPSKTVLPKLNSMGDRADFWCIISVDQMLPEYKFAGRSARILVWGKGHISRTCAQICKAIGGAEMTLLCCFWCTECVAGVAEKQVRLSTEGGNRRSSESIEAHTDGGSHWK